MLGSGCSSQERPWRLSGTPATPTAAWLRPHSPLTQEAAGPLPDPSGPPLPSKQLELKESGE